jgi:hypothetical protein
MAGVINDYFNLMFTKDGHIDLQEVVNLFEARILNHMNDELCKPFSDHEIGKALFQIGPLKAPGPHFSRETVINAVKQFFEEGRMPKGVNDTAIVLIPKVQHPENLKDYRPISLCNVI